MIETINRLLKDAGSKFSTEDGLTLVMFVGADRHGLRFLRKTFPTQAECLAFVEKACR